MTALPSWRRVLGGQPGFAEAASIVAARCHDGCMGKEQSSDETTSTPDQDKPAPTARFSSLPERIRPEDMIETQETEPPQDPEMGRDTNHDFFMRNIP